MATLWTNYYSTKVTVWTPINTRLATAENTYSGAGEYSDLVTTVGTTFSTILATMTGGIESITDPDYGMIAGLNCLLFG